MEYPLQVFKSVGTNLISHARIVGFGIGCFLGAMATLVYTHQIWEIKLVMLELFPT